MMSSTKMICAALCLATGTFGFVSAYAASNSSDWAARPYDYLIVDQDLRTVLEEYGRNLGMRMSISPSVQGRVKGNMARSSARAFLDALSQAYGLDWYHDGFTLHVSTSAEGRSRLLELQGLSFEAVLEGIKVAGLNDARFQFRPGPVPAVAFVSGPPRFVESIAETVSVMARSRKPALQEGWTMHVYRGTNVEKVTFPVKEEVQSMKSKR